MYKISESEFYDICDQIDELETSDFPYQYIPTVEELKQLSIETQIEKHIKYLIYLSNNPFEDDSPETLDMIKYVKKIIQENVEIIYED